jgi:2,3-bisphosphoglycerate-independent phosphoglycerate mutase
MGRYWAMDRDRRWDRTERAYRAIVRGEGTPVRDALQSIADAYAQGENDEFVQPRVVVDDEGRPVGSVKDGDAIIFFNFRSDRARQLSRALAADDFDGFDRGADRPRIRMATMTQYDEDLPLPVAFPPQELNDKLCDVLAARGLHSFRTA